MQITRSRWFFLAFTVVLGGALCAAQWIGGHPENGAGSLALLVGFGLLMVFVGRRSETMRGLSGPGADERFELIALRATAFAGFVVTLAVVAGAIARMARGHDPGPYGTLALVIAAAYAASVVWQRVRG